MSIKRTISKADLLSAIQGDGEFSVLAEGDAFVVLRWTDGQESAVFNLKQGVVTVGTPTGRVVAKMRMLADLFSAEVIGDDDENGSHESEAKEAFAKGGSWIGWPVLVIVLLALLIMKW